MQPVKQTTSTPGLAIRHVVVLLMLGLPAAAPAQNEDLRLPVSLDADSTAYDGKSSMVMFRGLRLTQGRLGIAADEGFASKMDFEDSTWHFQGNVVIDVENGHIESDMADMDEPMIMRTGASIRDVCSKLHKDFVRKFRYARVWGPSAKFEGQMVKSLDRVLMDGDIVEIHLT